MGGKGGHRGGHRAKDHSKPITNDKDGAERKRLGIDNPAEPTKAGACWRRLMRFGTSQAQPGILSPF